MLTYTRSAGWILGGVVLGWLARLLVDLAMQPFGISNVTGLYGHGSAIGAVLRHLPALPLLLMSVIVGHSSSPAERRRRGLLLAIGLIVWFDMQTWQFTNMSLGCIRSAEIFLAQFIWILGIHATAYATEILALFAGIGAGAALSARRPQPPGLTPASPPSGSPG